MMSSYLGLNTAPLMMTAILFLSSSLYPSNNFVDAFTGPYANYHLSRRKDSFCGRGGSSRWSLSNSRATSLLQGQSNIVGNEEILPIEKADVKIAPAKIHLQVVEETVPSSWNQAIHRFFIGDIGPPLVVLSISGFLYARSSQLSSIPFSITEATLFASSILLWWIQEYFFHRILLHSPSFDWIGKSIHRAHHEKKYFHISIDPPALLLGWLFAAHLAMKCFLPWHLCLTATIGYALAGLVYEWSHYIVHTKVKPPTTISLDKSNRNTPALLLSGAMISGIMSRLFSQMRVNHIRHHLVDDRYWYAFSVPAMDDIFDTNPDVRDVRKRGVGVTKKRFTKDDEES